MIVDFAPPARDIPALIVPHSRRCHPRSRPHPGLHCYHERELEDRVEEYLVTTYPQTKVARQERWAGIGVVDLVARTPVPFGWAITVIELKVTPARSSAHRQLAWYMRAAFDFYAQDDRAVVLTGVIGAFYIPYTPTPRPTWLAHWEMDVSDAA